MACLDCILVVRKYWFDFSVCDFIIHLLIRAFCNYRFTTNETVDAETAPFGGIQILGGIAVAETQNLFNADHVTKFRLEVNQR